MKVESISDKNFEGKAIFDKRLSKKEKIFVKNILDYEIDGIKNKKLLAGKFFDINFCNRNTRRTVHPKVTLYSCLEYFNRGGYINRIYRDSGIRYEDGVEQGAKELREYINRTEEFINKRLPTYYYNGAQKLGAWWKVFRKKV